MAQIVIKGMLASDEFQVWLLWYSQSHNPVKIVLGHLVKFNLFAGKTREVALDRDASAASKFSLFYFSYTHFLKKNKDP